MRLIYAIPFIISSLSILLAAGVAVRRRRARGAWFLVFMCLSAGIWSMFEGLRYLAPTLEADMVMTYLQYLGAATFIPFAILFTMAVFRLEAWINRTSISLFSIGVAVTLTLVWTDPIHHLVYTNWRLVDGGAFPMRAFTHGVLWYVIVVYHYLLTVAFTLLLVHVLQTSRGIYRIQAGLFISGVAIVWLLNTVYIGGYSPVPYMDIGQLSFVMMAGIMFLGFFRYNLLDVLPVARKNIFTELRTSVLVLDANNHLLDLNPAAETLLRICGAKSYGRDIEQLLEHQPEILQVLRKNTSVALPMDFKNRRCHFAIRFSPLTGRRGRSTGRIIIFHDITERKQAQEVIHESERFRGVLEMAGAVCHDLSQPAMAAGGYAEVILSNAPESGPLRESLLKIIEQVEKIGDINKKLLKITQYKAGNG